MIPPLVVGPFQCNCRLLVCPNTQGAMIIDPGDEPEKILEWLKKEAPKAKIQALFHTHAHLDHIGGTRKVKEALQAEGHTAEILLHQDDHEIYQLLPMQGQMFGMTYDPVLPVDRFIQDNELLQIGDLKMEILHTPGHSPGSVCLRQHEDSAVGSLEALFSGDTLFKDSIGRTDLWGADQEAMFKSIKQRIFTLDDDTSVCPGHGPDTRVGIEKRENPFFR